jgi:AraC-like DNA-binding protein
VFELIDAASLKGYSELVISLGGDPGALLLASGIDPEVLYDRDAYLSYDTVVDALERAAAVLECPDFGLQLAACQGLEILGPLGLVARYAATVEDGVHELARYMYLYSPAIRIALEPISPTMSRYSFQIMASGLPTRSQMEDLALGVALRAFQLLAGPWFRPRRVSISHRAFSDEARYRAFFDADVQFEQTWCGFEIRQSDLIRPIDRSDPLVRDVASRHLDSLIPSAADAPTVALKATIARMLPTGECTIETVAHRLAVHPRTLQRHLADTDSTFTELLNTVRRDHAVYYLRETSIPISQISNSLGYAQQSSFARACRGWFGTSPRAIRHGGPISAARLKAEPPRDG